MRRVVSSGLMMAVLALISTERLQIVNLPSMSSESMVGPPYSATRLDAPPFAHHPEDVEDEVLRVDPPLELPADLELDGLWDSEGVELASREEVLSLRGADAEGEGTRAHPGCTCASRWRPRSHPGGRRPPRRRWCARCRLLPCTWRCPGPLQSLTIRRIPWLTLIEHEGTVWSGMNAILDGLKTCIFLPDSVKTSSKSFSKFRIAGGPMTSLK